MSLGALGLGAPQAIGFGERIWRINWGLVLVLSAIAGVVNSVTAIGPDALHPSKARTAIQ